MTKRSFEDVINNLKLSVADYTDYVNFNKAQENSQVIDKDLEILNQLIGSKNIESDFENLLVKYPLIINSIPLLLATRNKKLPVFDREIINYNFDSKNPMTANDYLNFLKKVGLLDLLKDSKIHDLRDYYFGVEVGMDTNARKNRVGSTMEKVVENHIIQAKPEMYYKQLSKKEIANKFNLNLDDLIMKKDGKREAEKRFDFVVKHNDQIYLIETNFYGSGGSKLNETARSFKSLNKSLQGLKNVHFIWITDGVGWKSAKNNLLEAYEEMYHLYTLHDLEKGVLLKLFSN